MGVPKFYRWLSERYPCLSEVVKEYQIPEFDNLYLDMNGLIHNCSHPSDDVHFRISEEKMFADMFHYLEVLFRLIKPRKLLFMAVDGVAPRAKMNQQRGRRFKHAKEIENKEKEALRKGESLPDEKLFDSNCITPGTNFMMRLHEQLKYFVNMKISSDPLWQNVRVILSGHQVPGEGEHKIMEFIRHQKSQPDYKPDVRHCLFGLDADLMMLGLCSHEPYFSLLREEVVFGFKKNDQRVRTPETTTFHLLHLSLLREYLDLEFQALKTNLSFPYDLEHIIDDWVLMGFLVGNDFIPNLPHFHINKNALPLLYSAYIDVLPSLSGYINEKGVLNLERFEVFMQRLAKIDYEHFNDIYGDIKWLEERHGRKQLVAYDNSGPDVPDDASQKPKRPSDTLQFLLQKSAEVDDLLVDDDSSDSQEVVHTDTDGVDEDDDDDDDLCNSDEDKQFYAEFKAHKRNYYIEKLEYSEVDSDVLRGQAEGYVRAIQWILHYYYSGVCSWSWYYPHHYAPYVSDIRNFSSLKLDFELGHPFLPYEQLLGVLPAASRELLPAAYQKLMVSANSPIIDYYPVDFQTDKNGKQNDWEAVILIPFIDERRLISAMKDCELSSTEEEKLRNRHGPMQIYQYTDKDFGQYESPGHFPNLIHNYCQCQEVSRDAFVISADKLVYGLNAKTDLGIYIPGFPTTRHLTFQAKLKQASVVVFNAPSLNESMFLTLDRPADVVDIADLAKRYCGQSIFVSWPHLLEARVVSVSNQELKFTIDSQTENPTIEKIVMTHKDFDDWRSTEKEIRNKYAIRWGVDIGETQVIVHACPIVGRKYGFTQSSRVTLEKQWSPIASAYALQATVKDIKVNDATLNQFLTLSQVFPNNSTCFMLGQPGYGFEGRVLSTEKSCKGKVRIEFDNIHEAENEDWKKRIRLAGTNYMPGYSAARRLGISPHLLSRITGSIMLTLSLQDDEDSDSEKPGRSFSGARKVNVGLNLKFNKKNEEACGWTKKVESGWLYSNKTVEVLQKFMEEFPDFFQAISSGNNSSCDVYADVDVFQGYSTEKGWVSARQRARQLVEYVQILPCYQAERQPCGSTRIESDLLAGLLKHGIPTPIKLKPMVMQVRPHLLYKPDLALGSTCPDLSTVSDLYDRVVNVRQGFCVPVGMRGTIIGIKNGQKMMDVVYEVLFDKPFSGGLTVRSVEESAGRLYHVPSWAIINLSHGHRQQQEREKQGRPTAVVRPSPAKPQNWRAAVAALPLSTAPQSAVAAPAQSDPNSRINHAKPQPPVPVPSAQQTKANGKKQRKPAFEQQLQQNRAAVAAQPQPKLLVRPKAQQEAKPNSAASSSTKSAPSAASLPNPFMDIWNSLVQQHENATNQAAKIAESAARQNPPAAPAPVNKVPSLQEAARNLPKVNKAGKPAMVRNPAATKSTKASELPPPPAPPAPVAPISAFNGTPKGVPSAQPGPCGPSLSVQDLFKMAAGSVATTIPAISPPFFSHCIQLMDIAQQKGLAVPQYNYIPLQDGTIVAEIFASPFGVLSRCPGRNNREAAELAAAQALHHPAITSTFPMAGAHLQQVLNIRNPFAQPPPRVHVAVQRGPVPNSFVPMQVTRHSVHQQQPKVTAAATVSTRVVTAEVKPEAPPVKTTKPDVCEAIKSPARPSSFRPPGSRLAVRFHNPLPHQSDDAKKSNV